MAGWIKLSRGIQSHWVFSDAERFKAWCTMIMLVNYQDNTQLIEGELIQCKRGQSLFSIGTWVKKFGGKWTPQKVKTFFSLLEKDKMITKEGLRKTTRLTICKYESYQSEQLADKQEVTKKQLRGNQEVTTTKEGKEIEEGKEVKKVNRAKRFLPPTLEEIKAYCIERNNKVDPDKFFNHYEANGWMRGKSKIKKWKACIITWEKNSQGSSAGNQNEPTSKIGKTQKACIEAYEIIKNTEIDLS